MQQDVIPPKNRQQRGAIRPPVRVTPDPPIDPPREAFRAARSMDGMTTVRRSTIVQTETVVETPAAKVVTTQLVSDVTVVSAQRLMGIEATEEVSEATETAQTQMVVPTELAQSIKQKQHKKPVKEAKKRFDFKRWSLISAAVVLLMITGYVTIDTWLVNSKAASQLGTSQGGEDQATTSAETWTAAQEGQDETKVTKNALSSYNVAPDLPRALYSDKLDVSARILPMSVNTAGSIQAPVNIYDAGWYTGSVKPGETGAMFIDGHASGPTREGLFAYLDTLKVGDTLQVEKGDGTKLNYKVIHTETVPLGEVDMKKVLLPYGNALKAMNLMTCTGKWLPKEKTYDHRVLVYTQQI